MQISNSRLTCLVILVLIAAIFVPRDALAYVDPNSAGILYQILFPLFVVAVMAWRWIKEATISFWKRIMRRTD
jgi:hypothetical protein